MDDEADGGQPQQVTVESRAHGWRVDHYLARLFPNFSRRQIQRAIVENSILVNGLPTKSARRLRVNDRIAVSLPEPAEIGLKPEPMDLAIVFEDDSLVVVDKPPGLIVHPGRGNQTGTLAAGLQYHFDTLSDVGGQHRPGIVHRLDRDTSGLLVVAKDNQVHHRLSSQFENRTVEKEYVAITWGVVQADRDVITTFVRVHPREREKMTVCPEGNGARHAETLFEVEERFGGFTFVRLFPKTGRTHQLRVHMRWLGHPIVADRQYGGHADLRRVDLVGTRSETHSDRETPLIQRQALHARRLAFRHPATGKTLTFESAIPADMQRTLEALRSL